MMTQNKRLLTLMLSVVALLLVPFVAMQFSKEVHWSFFDFIIAAILLVSTAGIIELILRKVKTRRNRFLLVSIVAFILFIVWLELAVGIFGSPLAGS